MPDQRELYEDPEEAIRSAWAGIRTHMMTAMPAIVETDSPDGHTGRLVLAVMRAVEDKVFDKVTYQPFPLLADVPIHFPGAGGITHTFAVKALDEVMTIFSSRSIDAWHQSGGTQQPIFNRLHSLSDAMAIPGLRSDPRKLQQVSADSAQARDDAKHHVDDHHPTNGFHRKTVDPSTPAASSSFDPFTAATKFFEHLLHPTNGSTLAASDGATTHSYGLTHELGHVMAVVNGLHSVLAHPTDGAALTAKNLLHKVLAHPDLGSLLSAAGGQHLVQAHPEQGVMISSSQAVSISAPPGMLSLPDGGVSGGALAEGAASGNVGALGGDLSGELPSPQVVGITNVANGNALPVAGSDALAATAGVQIGHLYIDQAAVPGHNLLAVRMV